MAPRRFRGLLPLLLVAVPALALAEPRIALVIGNSEYPSGPLPNPANDAKLIGDTLSGLGFEVISRRNADQVAMKRAIQEFGARLEKAGPSAVGLFYYAGHGVQLNGRNYLIPTSARIEREGDVDIEAVSADWVIEQMRYARNSLNIVVLDACRNNPFVRSMRSVDRGLAVMDAPAGILIAYSTAPGSVAADGNGRNSPYTDSLTRAMRETRQPVEQVFKSVRVQVMGATGGKQVPWESSSLTGDFYFAKAARRAEAPAAPPAATAAADAGSPAAERPSGSWLSSLFGGKTDTSPARSAPPSGQVAGSRALALLGSLGVAAPDLDAARSYPLASVRPLLENSARRVTLGSSPEQIRDALALCRSYSAACQHAWYDDETLRSATLVPFELDVAPVTVAQFREFADANHYRTEAEVAGFAYALVHGKLESVKGGTWRNAVSGRTPEDAAAVVGVSFQDALAYCRWRGLRLPTEDEWEYAARGPERRVFPWGDGAEPVREPASTPPRASDGPAGGIGGRYKGLSGNVWQWVDTKVGARRVLKGGSWLEPNPANKRAAVRRYELPKRADEDSGFRCARTLGAWPDANDRLAQLSR